MSALTFGAPRYLPLLVIPAALLGVWLWRLLVRHRDLRRLSRHRVVPIRERFRFADDLFFWAAQLVAATLLLLAIARPQAPSSVPRRAGLDLVVLLDASASMRVADVAARAASAPGTGGVARDRWQRSWTARSCRLSR